MAPSLGFLWRGIADSLSIVVAGPHHRPLSYVLVASSRLVAVAISVPEAGVVIGWDYDCRIKAVITYQSYLKKHSYGMEQKITDFCVNFFASCS